MFKKFKKPFREIRVSGLSKDWYKPLMSFKEEFGGVVRYHHVIEELSEVGAGRKANHICFVSGPGGKVAYSPVELIRKELIVGLIGGPIGYKKKMGGAKSVKGGVKKDAKAEER